MIDHFLGNTTRVNLHPSTEFYIVIGRAREIWLFFKLQLKKSGKLFFLIDSRVYYQISYIFKRPFLHKLFSFSTFPSLHLV